MPTTLRTTGRGERERLLVEIAGLASEAGARILAVAAECDAPRMKADKSPVTAADEIAEAMIRERLTQLLPGVPFVGEEAVAAGDFARPNGAYFLVDPIDGTREMIAGRNEYTVNIALVEDRTPVLGVIFAPATGELFAGADGAAWRAMTVPGAAVDPAKTEKIRVRPRREPMTALVSRSHPDPVSEAFLSRLEIGEKIPLGSSLKFARLAEGAADVYVRLATINEWDIAAGHALLDAAGGSVTAPDGAPLRYGMQASGFLVNGFIAWGAG
jgi:3'(2'), 5'-bisphosphate nucleotidase